MNEDQCCICDASQLLETLKKDGVSFYGQHELDKYKPKPHPTYQIFSSAFLLYTNIDMAKREMHTSLVLITVLYLNSLLLPLSESCLIDITLYCTGVIILSATTFSQLLFQTRAVTKSHVR